MSEPDATAADRPALDPEQPMFLRLPLKCRQVVIDALNAAGFLQEAKNCKEFTEDYADPGRNANREAWLALAKGTVAKDGEIEFDSDATISHSGDKGEYVLGWVWVEDPDYEDEE